VIVDSLKVTPYSLVAHPDHLPRGISGITVRWIETKDGILMLRWQVAGVDTLALPPFAGKGRGDELWHTTCFELVLKDRAGDGYLEFNFSPSERWAAYRFEGYREGMAEADVAAPDVSGHSGEFLFMLTANLDRTVLDNASAAGLSAVIEEKDGTKSYWALAHPPGKPDFHDPACFALTLPASPQP
jgi:hypothetical protein